MSFISNSTPLLRQLNVLALMQYKTFKDVFNTLQNFKFMGVMVSETAEGVRTTPLVKVVGTKRLGKGRAEYLPLKINRPWMVRFPTKKIKTEVFSKFQDCACNGV